MLVESRRLSTGRLLSDDDLLDVREENVVLPDEELINLWVARSLASDQVDDIANKDCSRMLLVWVVGVEGAGIFRHATVELFDDLVDFSNGVSDRFVVSLAWELEKWLSHMCNLDRFDNVSSDQLGSEGISWVFLQESDDTSSDNSGSPSRPCLRISSFKWPQSMNDFSHQGLQIMWSQSSWKWASRRLGHEDNRQEPVRHSRACVLEVLGVHVRLLSDMRWEWLRRLVRRVRIIHRWDLREILDVWLLRSSWENHVSKNVLDNVGEVVLRLVLWVSWNILLNDFDDGGLHCDRSLLRPSSENLLDLFDNLNNLFGLQSFRSVVFGFFDTVLFDNFDH